MTIIPSAATNKSILAISWNIATEPKLYRQLASNPYSPAALQIILERFPVFSTTDTIEAVILAEPEGNYDRNFNKLPQELKAAELHKQTDKTSEITRLLNDYYSQSALKFAELSDDLIYDILFKATFGTSNLQEVEQRYSQNQRKYLKLLILNLIVEHKVFGLKEKQENQKSGKPFSKIAFAALSIISFFYLTFIVSGKQSSVANATNQVVHEQVLSAEDQKESPALPVHLIIPSINVDTVVENVGLTSEGAMEVPNNASDVGWYKLGPSPGEAGSAVISGHFDGREGNTGVFNNLNKLKPGDKIYVLNDQRTTTTFTVRESRTYSPGYADEVFLSNGNGTHLNLITCDGVWDGAKKSYTKRLVVFADIMQ